MNPKLKRIELDETFEPISIMYLDGTLVDYSKEKSPKYVIEYNYLFDKLISIKNTNIINNVTQKYSLIRIFLARFKALVLFDKPLYFDNKNDYMLIKLYNNMLVY